MKHTVKNELIFDEHFDKPTNFAYVSYFGKLDYSGKDKRMEGKFPSIAYAIKKKLPVESIKSLVEVNQGDAINQSILVNGKMNGYGQPIIIKVPTIIYALEQKRMDVFELLIKHSNLDIAQVRTMEKFNDEEKQYELYGSNTLLNIVLDNGDINDDNLKLVLNKCNRDTFELSGILDILKKNPDIGCLVIEKFNLVNRLDEDSNRIIDLVVKEFNLNSHNTELLKLIKILRDLGSVEPNNPISFKGAGIGKLIIPEDKTIDVYADNHRNFKKILEILYNKYQINENEFDSIIANFKGKDFNGMMNTKSSKNKTIPEVIDGILDSSFVDARLTDFNRKKFLATIFKAANEDEDLFDGLLSALLELDSCLCSQIYHLMMPVQDKILDIKQFDYENSKEDNGDFINGVVTKIKEGLGESAPKAVMQWYLDMKSNIEPENWSPYTTKIRAILNKELAKKNANLEDSNDSYHFKAGLSKLTAPLLKENGAADWNELVGLGRKQISIKFYDDISKITDANELTKFIESPADKQEYAFGNFPTSFALLMKAYYLIKENNPELVESFLDSMTDIFCAKQEASCVRLIDAILTQTPYTEMSYAMKSWYDSQHYLGEAHKPSGLLVGDHGINWDIELG